MQVERQAKQGEVAFQEPHEYAAFISSNQVSNIDAWCEKIEIVFPVEGLKIPEFGFNPVFAIRRARLNGLVVILIAKSQRVIRSRMGERLMGCRAGRVTGDCQAAGQEEQEIPADTQHNTPRLRSKIRGRVLLASRL